MDALRRLIREAEAELAAAKASASPPGHPRRFLEFDAFAAATRLKALRDAERAIAIRDGGTG